jgi:hypothetical protein
MTNLFTELLKFFSEFTWKKCFSILVMLLIGFALVSIYELYTSTFRFSRLQKAADLLSKIEEIDSRGTNASQELLRARNALVTQAVEAIDTKPITLKFIPSTLQFSMDSGWKFLAGASFWWAIALTQIRGITDAKKRSGIFGMTFVGFITGFAGIFIPSVWWPWFHIFILPWVFLICLVVLVLPIGYFASKRAANKKAQEKAQ